MVKSLMEGPEIKQVWMGERWSAVEPDDAYARPHLGQDNSGQYYATLEYYEFGDRNTHMGTWSGPMTERAARDFLVSELKPWIGADTELEYLNNVSDFYPELREAAEHIAARRKLEKHLDGGNKQDLPTPDINRSGGWER
jgi:hypothetical protein